MPLSGALAGLANVYPGMLQGRVNENQADLSDLQLSDAKRDAAALAALGRLASINQGPQAPAPGQPSQPMQHPGQMPQQPQMGGGGPPPGMGGPPPGGMQMGGPRPDDPNSPMNWISSQGPTGIVNTYGGGSSPPMPQGGPPTPRPAVGGMPGGPPQGGQPQMPQMGGQQQPQPGGADWRQLAKQLQQANPDAPPDVIAAALTKAIPLMNLQSQAEWRQINGQYRQQQTERLMSGGSARPSAPSGQRAAGGEGLEAFGEGQGRKPLQQEHPFGKGERGLLLEQWYYEAYPKEHDGKYPSYDELIEQRQRLMPKSATQFKQEEKDRVGRSIVRQLDSTIADVVNSMRGAGDNPVGLFGSANRAIDFALDIMSKDHSNTTAADFQSKISLLRPQVMRYLTNTAKVSNKELGDVEAGLRGLSPGSTRQSTISSMKYLQNVIRTYMSDEGGKGGKASPKDAPAQGGPSVDEFRANAKKSGYTDQQIDEFLKLKNQSGEGGGDVGGKRAGKSNPGKVIRGSERMDQMSPEGLEGLYNKSKDDDDFLKQAQKRGYTNKDIYDFLNAPYGQDDAGKP